jgi:hypothetical protein
MWNFVLFSPCDLSVVVMFKIANSTIIQIYLLFSSQSLRFYRSKELKTKCFYCRKMCSFVHHIVRPTKVLDYRKVQLNLIKHFATMAASVV